MNLDDYQSFQNIDLLNMLEQIDNLPDQLQAAMALGMRHPLPFWSGIQQVLVAGMGGSAIGADLLAAYIAPICHVPVFVHRDYGLPAWASGTHTLVITSSHSGNTEEILSAFDVALARGCRLQAIATGGKLAQAAVSAGIPLWTFEHTGPPRAAVGYSFGLLLAAMGRLNLIPDLTDELEQAVKAMREQQALIQAGVPAAHNLAKRIAGQLVGRAVAVVGSGILAPVARRWKGQMNEIAKAWAQFEFLPEANHNMLAGILNPEDLFNEMMVLFLRSPSDHPRNRLRIDLTCRELMLEGLSTDFVDAKGEAPLAHLWTCLHLGDYVAYYLAMAYGVDPTPVAVIENFKREMRAMGE